MSTKLIQIFHNNLTWKVLTYFLAHPASEVYVKELARRLKVGPTSLNNTLRKLKKVGLLKKQERARSHFYSLQDGLPVVKALKTTYFLARLEDAGAVDKFLESDEGLISLCVYGSYADGSFDEKSDLDLLMISQKEKTAFNSAVSELEKSLKVEINIEVFTLAKWRRSKEHDKAFYQEVSRSNIVIYGSEI